MPNSTTHRGIHITRAEVPGASYEWTHDETNAHGMAPDIETAIAQIDLHLGSPGPTSAVSASADSRADLCRTAVPHVQALEWKSVGLDGQSLEASALGLEVCYRIHGKPGDWTLTSPGAREYVHTPGYKARKDATAAAQADYEARILAAIQPDPEPQPVEELDLVGGPPILDLPDLIAEGRKAHESLCRGFDGRGTSTRTLVGDLTAALARATTSSESALNTLPDGPDGEVV